MTGRKTSHGQTAGGEPDPTAGAAAAEQWLCGDIDLRIDRDGIWFYHGSPIGRKELVRLFASILHRDEAGDYWLVTPVERARIHVDDAPFVAVGVVVEGDGHARRVILHTSVGDSVPIDGDHPLRIDEDAASGEPRPYILVRDGLEALIARSVFYELVELGEPGRDGRSFGLWSSGRFHLLGRVEPE